MIIIMLLIVAFLSVMAGKGKIFIGSAGDGITMWAILSVAVVSGFVAGIEYEKKDTQKYISQSCFVRGDYTICRHTDYDGDEPAASGSKWNEH